MAYDFSALKVLVVDDNVHMHQILRSILGAMRITDVMFAVDVKSAAEEMAHFRPDIIVTDVMVGDQEGLDLIEKVRKGEVGFDPYVPVIALTGYTERRMITRARDVGVHEVLAKPVSIEMLYQRLVNITTKPRPFIKSEGYFGPCRRRQVKAFQGREKRGQDGGQEGGGEEELAIPEVSDFEAA